MRALLLHSPMLVMLVLLLCTCMDQDSAGRSASSGNANELLETSLPNRRIAIAVDNLSDVELWDDYLLVLCRSVKPNIRQDFKRYLLLAMPVNCIEQDIGALPSRWHYLEITCEDEIADACLLSTEDTLTVALACRDSIVLLDVAATADGLVAANRRSFDMTCHFDSIMAIDGIPILEGLLLALYDEPNLTISVVTIPTVATSSSPGDGSALSVQEVGSVVRADARFEPDGNTLTALHRLGPQVCSAAGRVYIAYPRFSAEGSYCVVVTPAARPEIDGIEVMTPAINVRSASQVVYDVSGGQALTVAYCTSEGVDCLQVLTGSDSESLVMTVPTRVKMGETILSAVSVSDDFDYQLLCVYDRAGNRIVPYWRDTRFETPGEWREFKIKSIDVGTPAVQNVKWTKLQAVQVLFYNIAYPEFTLFGTNLQLDN